MIIRSIVIGLLSIMLAALLYEAHLKREIREECAKSSMRVYSPFGTLKEFYECADGKTYMVK